MLLFIFVSSGLHNIKAPLDFPCSLFSGNVGGDTVKLYCNATGSPTLHISWTFDRSVITANENSRISLSNDSRELTITNVKRRDSGDYRCLVTNRVGNDTSDPSVINVLCKYRISLLFKVMKSYSSLAKPSL